MSVYLSHLGISFEFLFKTYFFRFMGISRITIQISVNDSNQIFDGVGLAGWKSGKNHPVNFHLSAGSVFLSGRFVPNDNEYVL